VGSEGEGGKGFLGKRGLEEKLLKKKNARMGADIRNKGAVFTKKEKSVKTGVLKEKIKKKVTKRKDGRRTCGSSEEGEEKP